MFTIIKKYHFYAAHRNQSIGWKCQNLHGHTYYVQVGLDLEQKQWGITMQFQHIDDIIDPIIKKLDHWLLLYDQDPWLDIIQQLDTSIVLFPYETSAENLARYIYEQIAQYITVSYVDLQETTTSTVRYTKTA